MYWSASFCARGMAWVPSTITPLSRSSVSVTACATTLRGRNGFPLGRVSVVMVSGIGGHLRLHLREFIQGLRHDHQIVVTRWLTVRGTGAYGVPRAAACIDGAGPHLAALPPCDRDRSRRDGFLALGLGHVVVVTRPALVLKPCGLEADLLGELVQFGHIIERA